MYFIEAIQRFQTVGDRQAIEIIREIMGGYDFLRRGISNVPGPEYYVAFQCMRLLSGKLSTIKYSFADSGIDAKRDSPEWIFADHTRDLREWTGIELTVENYPEHEPYLRDYFVMTFHQLKTAYELMIGARETLWLEMTREIVTEHWDAIEAALTYAFARVDTSRGEREIVRYVNRAVKTAYIRSQFRGLRRVRRDKRTRYVEPKYFGPVYAIFGTNLVDINALTARQRTLYDKMAAIIEGDAAASRFESYYVDHSGGYRIKNRYIADRLGVHEASLCRALRRIQSVK